MKKYINYSFSYAILAMVAGVFYREFTKFNNFNGVTILGKIHGHVFALGVLVFLIVALFTKNVDLETQRPFKAFMYLYNTGLPLTAIMMCLRGVVEVLNIQLSNSANAIISGTAGIAHIMLGTGIVLLFISIKKAIQQ